MDMKTRELKPAGGESAKVAGDHKSKSSDGRMGRKSYEKELEHLQAELVQVQLWARRKKQRICIIFEGRDGAGKGGTIKAITERVSPRAFRVVALQAPTEREKTQLYLQRYMTHFPAAGDIVIFDRSWYNRAGVESVMGFCSKKELKDFLTDAPRIERALVESGIILLKYWLEVSPEEQTRRLQDRIHDGRKIWKLSDMDIKSYARWDDYTRARDRMFAATHTDWAPWLLVHSDDKRRARLNIIADLLRRIPYNREKRQKIKLPHRKVDTSAHSDFHNLFIDETY